MFSLLDKLFSDGGWVLYPIFGVSLVSWQIALGKLLTFARLRSAAKRLEAAIEVPGGAVVTGNPALDDFARSLLSKNAGPVQAERAWDELMIALVPPLERGFSTIGVCIVMAPLLGLLGTISGMNSMFNVISRFGFGNPTIMASGISMALEATLTGLAVAVAALLFLDYLTSEKQKLVARLREDRDRITGRVPARAAPLRGGTMRYNRQLHEEQQHPEINLAPFVDTIMILLIFFVVTANLYVETGVDVSKPKAQSAQSVGQKSLLIGITREGTIHVYGRQTTLERLRTMVEQEVGKQPDIAVVIIADRDGGVGRTVDVIDQCTLAGAQKISIAAGKN